VGPGVGVVKRLYSPLFLGFVLDFKELSARSLGEDRWARLAGFGIVRPIVGNVV
jgi:hypothetical protein